MDCTYLGAHEIKNQRFLNVIVNGMTVSERIRSQALRYKLLNFNHKIF